MASLKKKRKGASVASMSTAETGLGTVILHEGFCTKESGTAFLGKTNWRKRWFKLTQRRKDVLLEYYKGKHDRTPAGSVKLDVTYCTRQLESHEKPYPNCFAVGPLIDDGALRTYYISCPTLLAMQEWMTVIDAAIQGVPEQAKRRMRTVTNHFSLRKKSRVQSANSKLRSQSSISETLEERGGLDLSSVTDGAVLGQEEAASVAVVDHQELKRDDLSDDEVCAEAEISDAEDEDEEDEEEEEEARGGAKGKGGARRKNTRKYECPESGLKPSSRLILYDNQVWRMEHWKELCILTRTLRWSKRDTKDGITISRTKFGRSSGGYAVMKLDGILASDPETVFNFLKISTQQGGKLDYIFRNETLLDEIEEEPKATLIFNQFQLPLPRISTRDVVAMKMWIPEYLTSDGTCGMVMYSIDHPQAPPPEKDSRRININTSGLVLEVHPGPDGALHTHMTILMRLALYGALHRMLKGAYNSGLLKLGLRTTFQHIQEQLQRFIDLTDI